MTTDLEGIRLKRYKVNTESALDGAVIRDAEEIIVNCSYNFFGKTRFARPLSLTRAGDFIHVFRNAYSIQFKIVRDGGSR